MKRNLPFILFLLVLVLPFVVQRFVRTSGQAARVDGAIRLTIITPHNQDIRNEFSRVFDAWHRKKYSQPADLTFLTPGGTGDIRRFLESTYGDRAKNNAVPDSFNIDIDLVWGGGDFFFDNEIKSFLAPVDLPSGTLESAFPSPDLAGVRLYDFAKGKPVRWVGVCISSFGIVYNPDVYQVLKLPPPGTWNDLARPELAGWVAMANPLSSSSAAVSYSMVLQRHMADQEDLLLPTRPDLKALSGPDRMKNPEYKAAVAKGWRNGMGTLTLIAANARYFTDSGTQPPSDVASGDAAAGMAIDFYGRVYEETVGSHRLRYFEPPHATALNPDPIAILLGVRGERYVHANRFIEFLLTPEAQQIWIKRPGVPGGPRSRALRRPPIRRDIYPPATDPKLWTDPELNPFTSAGDFNRRSEWDTLFTDTRLVWAAAWIDGREDLKAAHRAILALPDLARRDTLLAELATFPMTMADVEQLQADRRAATARKELNEWRAKRRVELAAAFRSHYRSLLAKARSPVSVR